MTGLRALILIVVLMPAVPASAAVAVDLTVGNAEGAAGQSVTVPVTLDPGAFRPTTIVFDLRYDRYKLAVADGGVDYGPAAGSTAFNKIVNEEGRVTFVFWNDTELATGVLCYVTFTILDGPAGDIPVTFAEVSLTNADVAGGIPFATHDGVIHSIGETDTRFDCFGLFDKALNTAPEGEYVVETLPAPKAPAPDGAASAAVDTGSIEAFPCAARIWLPLDPGIFASDVDIYYFDPQADAWMDAEAAGCVIPGSYAQEIQDGAARIGFLARQGGIYVAILRVKNQGAGMDGCILAAALAAMMAGAAARNKKRNGTNR